MSNQAFLNLVDKELIKPLVRMFGWTRGVFSPDTVKVISGNVVVALNSKGSLNLQLGNAPGIVQGIMITATSLNCTARINRSDTSEDMLRDDTPIEHLGACVHNTLGRGNFAPGIPPFAYKQNCTLGFSFTDGSGAENTVRVSVLIRERVGQRG